MKRKPSSTKKFGRPGDNPAAQRIMNRIEKSESLHRARKTVREHDEDPPPDAEAAGAQYAQEQLESNYFMDWVREQLREASRMDPDKVLPLETQQDAMEIAKNMLQQLQWDTQRDLDGRQIARLIGVDSTSHEDVKEFFKGFRDTLSMNREWLAGELLEIKGEMGGGRTEEPSRRRSGVGRPLIDDKLYSVTWRGGRAGPMSDKDVVALVRDMRRDWRESGRQGTLEIQVWYRDGSLVPYADLERRVGDTSGGRTQEARRGETPDASPLSGPRKEARDEAIRQASDKARQTGEAYAVWMDRRGEFRVSQAFAAKWEDIIAVAHAPSGAVSYKRYGLSETRSRHPKARRSAQHRRVNSVDHTATLNELALILRGDHPAWEGDRRANGYSFLTRIADDMPEEAASLGKDIAKNTEDFATETGISPNTLRRASAILLGQRQGTL
jgi:hypothetical protein